MSQVQFDASFNVAAVNNPLTVTPTSDQFDLTVGTPADGTPACTVTGGQAPYTYTMDANSDPMPPGISFDEDGNGNVTLAGTPTTSGTYGTTNGCLLDITDSAGNVAQ